MDTEGTEGTGDNEDNEALSEFQKNVLRKLTFAPEHYEHYTLYRNVSRPDLGYCLHYARPGHYLLGIADYTIPGDFSLPFSVKGTSMRFGMFYAGQTEYQIEGQTVSFTTPSSFFVVESGLRGIQRWKKGCHYHGVEITIFEEHFSRVVKPLYPRAAGLESFQQNNTYHYLPEEIVRIIEQTKSLAENNRLTALYLESKVMECIAILTNVLHSSPNNAFAYQIDYGSVPIGEKRRIRLMPSDIRAIQNAHDILSREAIAPPTIEQLSRQVLLNPQKLKAGFSHYYHMPIGKYLQTVRMTRAANLLSTTGLSIEGIAQRVGYQHSSNFARTFKKVYGASPLDFRRAKSI
jgi:AraC-like DNA-binding protein